MYDLHKAAPGNVFLETANYLLLFQDVKVTAEDFWEFLRPACLVYICDEKPDLDKVAKLLESHPSGVTLLSWRNGAMNFPHLMQEGESVRVYEP